MALNYDFFIRTIQDEDGSIWQAQIRNYDAGKETSDGGRGKYQKWTRDNQVKITERDLIVYHSFQSELLESGWKWYYNTLSDEDKQKYIEQCNLRASQQQQRVEMRTVPLVIVKPKPDTRGISESLSELKDLC